MKIKLKNSEWDILFKARLGENKIKHFWMRYTIPIGSYFHYGWNKIVSKQVSAL